MSLTIGPRGAIIPGMKAWTENEDVILLEHYKLGGASKCAELTKRSPRAVIARANKLGLGFRRTKWQTSELEYLKENYGKQGGLAVAATLNRTHGAVRRMASELGVRGKASGTCSRISIEWLQSFNNPNILHAENEGEQWVAGYQVDGYDPSTNTVYEFHGDIFHGNLDIFEPNDTPNPFDRRMTAEQLWQKTYDRMQRIAEKANLVFIWENDYRQGKDGNVWHTI